MMRVHAATLVPRYKETLWRTDGCTWANYDGEMRIKFCINILLANIRKHVDDEKRPGRIRTLPFRVALLAAIATCTRAAISRFSSWEDVTTVNRIAAAGEKDGWISPISTWKRATEQFIHCRADRPHRYRPSIPSVRMQFFFFVRLLLISYCCRWIRFLITMWLLAAVLLGSLLMRTPVCIVLHVFKDPFFSRYFLDWSDV